MCFIVSPFNINRHDFCIDLCSSQMPVTKEFLNIPDISTVLQHVGGAGSSYGVGRYSLSYPGLHPVFSYYGLDASGVQRTA